MPPMCFLIHSLLLFQVQMPSFCSFLNQYDTFFSFITCSFLGLLFSSCVLCKTTNPLLARLNQTLRTFDISCINTYLFPWDTVVQASLCCGMLQHRSSPRVMCKVVTHFPLGLQTSTLHMVGWHCIEISVLDYRNSIHDPNKVLRWKVNVLATTLLPSLYSLHFQDHFSVFSVVLP